MTLSQKDLTNWMLKQGIISLSLRSQISNGLLRNLSIVSGAQGFNVGMNQGDVAGAGISAHLHQHVVPRWPGDQNFMPIIGRTKTLPELLGETRTLLADAWPTAAR